MLLRNQGKKLVTGKLAGFFSSHGLKIIAHLQNLSFGNQKSVLPVYLRVDTEATGIMHQRLASDCQLETVTRETFICPSVNGRVRNAFNNLRGLPGIIEPLASSRIDEMRFDLFHRRRLGLRFRKVTRNLRKFFRALPGHFVKGNEGVGLTGSAPTVQSEIERRTGPNADWRSDATGFYE